MGWKEVKKALKKAWRFIWHSNSLASWIVNIILAFLLIKFVFYPGISLLVGTSVPVVAVISNSMEQPSNWEDSQAICSNGRCTQEEWYLEKGITPNEFADFPFSKGFNKGDIMLVRGKKPEEINIGDVIVFESGKSIPIIHRVVNIFEEDEERFFETKGDNNAGQIKNQFIDENRIPADDVFGVAYGKIPYLGYVKILFTDYVVAPITGN